MKKSFLILIAGLYVILTGCSSTPSASNGEQAIQDRIKQESEGRIKLTEFQKTNGQQREVMGVKMYALEFDAQIEFTEDCKWITGMFGQQLSFRTSKPAAQKQTGFDWKTFREAADNPGTMVAKGQKVKISGVVRFVKKEKGWAVEGIQLGRATLVDASASPSKPEAGLPKPAEKIKTLDETIAEIDKNLAATKAKARALEATAQEKRALLEATARGKSPSAQRAACIAYLKQIDSAKESWALENKKRNGATPSMADLVPKYIRTEPRCQAGGIYAIGALGVNPTCSIGGHALGATQ